MIWHCLKELYERKKYGLIDHVVFMGAPISGEDTQLWKDYLSVVSGRCINCFTDKDWVLGKFYNVYAFVQLLREKKWVTKFIIISICISSSFIGY